MLVSKNCDNCHYCGFLVNGGVPYCKYLLVTDHRRPCPPGDGCTVKVPIKLNRKRRIKDDKD